MPQHILADLFATFGAISFHGFDVFIHPVMARNQSRCEAWHASISIFRSICGVISMHVVGVTELPE